MSDLTGNINNIINVTGELSEPSSIETTVQDTVNVTGIVSEQQTLTATIKNQSEITGVVSQPKTVAVTMAATSISSGSMATTGDYNFLINKPSIEGVTLVGNKTYEELNMNHLTNMEIESMLT